jgi:putative phosphoribosyl transferase
VNRYQDRRDAGKQLAQALHDYSNRDDTLVLALPRGGVPVAYEVARALHAPLDVFIVRKIGVPGHSELAMGAIAPENTVIFNDSIIKSLNISDEEIALVKEKELKELERRQIAYRGHKPFPSLKNKTVILVDDGIATGASMHAAIVALQKFKPAAIVCAVPVSSEDAAVLLAPIVSDFICPLIPSDFSAVGQWYEDFSQTEDEEVRELLG